MALELMPNGTFKKLNATQTKALDRHYERLRKEPLTKTMGYFLPSAIAAGIVAVAYVFRDDLKDDFDNWKTETKEGLVNYLGGGVWHGFTAVLDTFGYAANPRTPEFITVGGREIGPLSRCKRWETDYVEANEKIEAAGDNPLARLALGIAMAEIIRQMKKEDCTRPVFITTENWFKA